MKTRFWREVIVAVGALPGLWLGLGIDPEAVVTYAIIDVISKALSTIANDVQPLTSILGFVYTVFGVVASVSSWVGIYYVGGGWGVLTVLAAFVGGFLITQSLSFGIWLIIGALVLAPFLPVDKNHSLDEQ